MALRQSKMARSVTLLAGGTAAGQAIVVLSSPIITRLYTPGDFGTLAAYAALVNLVAVIASLRFDSAILLPENDEDAANVFALALLTTALLTLASATVVALAGEPLLLLLRVPELIPVRWTFPLSVFAIGVLQSLSYWATRRSSYRVVAQTKVAQGASAVTAQISLGLLSFGPVGLIVGHVLGQTAGATALARNALSRSGDELSSVTRRGILAASRAYARHAAIATPGGLLNTAGLVMPALLLPNLNGVEAAGWFALAQRIIGTPLKLITGSVAQVYFPEAARLAHSDPDALLKLFLRSSRVLAAIALAPISIVIAFGPLLLGVIFGEQWTTAGHLARLLSIAYLGQAVVSPLTNTLYVLNAPGLHTALDAFRAGLTILALVVPSKFGLSLESTIATYSFSMAVVYVLFWLLVLRGIRIRALSARLLS